MGPARGGRVTAVTGFRGEPYRYLMGSVGGGIWETTDAGETWKNVSDGELGVGPVGALAVAPSNPERIYAGTGSGGVRGNVSVGDGMYRSDDGGGSWRHLGLPESHHINVIRVHPDDPDRLWVTALGHVFGDNPERGIYRSVDGGGSWEQVLSVSDSTGAIDLIMSPDDPATLYAAMWTAERKPWAMFSGSTEGGIYKTTDGGDSWEKLGGGLPEMVGRIGLAVSPADPDRIYALVEADGDERGLYRSEDRGTTWSHVSDDRNMTARPWYYMHVDVDPTDADVVYISNESFFRSDDAGRTIEPVSTPHGDNHDLWINPDDPENWIQSNDGGANVTFNGGETWSTQMNQPTAEFYTVEADDRFPYRLYAPQQDNSTISLPSKVTGPVITPSQEWFAGPGCETGPLAVHPEDPNVVYGACKGRIWRMDRDAEQHRPVWIYPLEYHGRSNAELRYRRQWNSQIEFSPHDPDVLYHPSQYVHLTRNEGQSWETISPDLTRWEEHAHHHETPPGGPLTYDQTGVEIYGTIFAFEESPHREGLLWAGSDDGAIHISRNGGDSWDDITPEGLPLHSTVNDLVLSPRDPAKAYAVVHRYRMDDFHPYVYRTTDYGETWTLLTDGTNGIPADHPTRAIAVDPEREGLLFVGTEFGLFVSFDDGASWRPFQQNLPTTPVTDLLIKRGDLVVATQGRSLWILDDLSPLRQLTDRVASSPAHLYDPPAAHRLRLAYEGERGNRWAENPEEGALIHYHLGEDVGGPVTLEIRESDGDLVKRYSSSPGEDAEVAGEIPAEPGLNRMVWDLKYPGAYLAPGVNEGFRSRISVVTGYTGGAYAVPGTYTVTLRVDGAEQSRELEVLKDPRLPTTVAELRESFDFQIRVRDRISEIQRGVARGQEALDELERVIENSAEAGTVARAREAKAALEEVLGELYKHGEKGDHAHLHPELTTSYARIYTMLAEADYRPPDSAHERWDDLQGEYEELMGRLRRLLDRDVTDDGEG